MSVAQTATRKKEDAEKRTLLAKLDRLFRIGPTKVKAKDGSGEQITIEHRIGRSAGAFTKKELMDKLGLEAEFKEYVLEIQRKVTNKDLLKEMMDDRYGALKRKLTKVISDYRGYLERLYGNAATRAMKPMFSFMPLGDGTDGIFIQGLRDANTLKPVVYDNLEDAMVWVELVYSQTYNWRVQNEEAAQTAKAMVTLPNINKDLKFRAQAIVQGKLPERIGFAGDKK